MLCWLAPGRPMATGAWVCCCRFRAGYWPRVGAPRLSGNCGKGSEGKKGMAVWFQVLIWIWAWKEKAWSCRPQLDCGIPSWLCEAICPLMWKLLVEGLASPEAVFWCRRDGACPGGAVLLAKWEPGTAEDSASVAVGVWLARRQSRTLLMCVSWVVVSLRCCESSFIWHLSLADCSSCWLSLLDSTAREQSDDPPVVMVVMVMMRTAGCFWAVLARGFGHCSVGTGAVLSTAGGSPGEDGPSNGRPVGPSMLQAVISLDPSASSLARARAQFMPNGRG